ncbi:MAG: hypothetical protein KW788_04565 [Candidatus Doudnabacteria bacterium]|nr:hypothetical protein [Candidatus Doudnabacteria bacterium]
MKILLLIDSIKELIQTREINWFQGLMFVAVLLLGAASINLVYAWEKFTSFLVRTYRRTISRS